MTDNHPPENNNEVTPFDYYPELTEEEFEQATPPSHKFTPDHPLSYEDCESRKQKYKPEYLQFMEEMLVYFDLSPEKQSPKKDYMVEKIIEMCPDGLPLKDTAARYMATFLRKVKDRNGGARTQDKKKQQSLS